MCSSLNSVAVVVPFIISSDADVFTPESLCLILTQKVAFCVWARPRRDGGGGGGGGGSKGLELESQSDKGKLKSNVQQFDFEPHESTLGTVASVKFICAGSTVSFWIGAIGPHSCRQECLCSPLFLRVVGRRAD